MPPMTGSPRARQASAMPSIASDSCHITSGCSGLPKFRQLTTRDRSGADAGEVQHRLGHDEAVPGPRVDRAPPVVAVGGERQAPAGVGAGGRVLEPQHRGVAARAHHGVEEELVVVLRPDPRRVVERGRAGASAASAVGTADGGPGRPLGQVGRLGARPVVERSGVVQARGRDVGEHLAVEAVEDPQPAAAVGPGSVTRPTTVARTSQRSHSASTSSRSSGVTMASIRSWDSARHHLERLHARPRGAAPRRRRRPCPTPPRDAVSLGGAR